MWKVYCKKLNEFQRTHHYCEVEGCRNYMSAVHHKKGRIGKNLLDETTWLAVCNSCHAKIHKNPAWAMSHGYMLDRLKLD